MSESAIRLRGVVKRYGVGTGRSPITAVDGLDLDVPYGTCVGLLGPNGAGKSTTVKALTAQVIADEGEIEVLGYQLPEDSKQARALMGVVPQLDNLDVSLTVEQNLLVFTHLYRVPAARRRAAIDRALAIANLGGREAVEVYGPPARLHEIEVTARGRGWSTRRTGTSISILGGNGDVDIDGHRRVTNLEDVFVLLTGEEIT